MGYLPNGFTFGLVAFAALSLAACSGDSDVDGGNPDSGSVDTGTVDTGTVDTGTVDTGTGDTGGTDAGNDAGMDGGVGDLACPTPVVFPALNGPAGAPIAGSITVYVTDDFDVDLGLSGAVVRVSRGGTELEGVTDSAGCLQFDDAAFDGPVDVHAFANGRVYLSVLGQDTDVLSVGLIIPGGQPPALVPATVTGNIIGLETLTTTTATVAQVGIVSQIGLSAFVGQPAQMNRPGGQNVGQNVALVGGPGFNFTDYSFGVNADLQAGVWVSGGIVEFPPVGNPVVTATHLGVATNVAAVSGETVTQDLTITHPLDVTHTVSFGAAPNLPNTGLFSFLFLPTGGTMFLGFGDTGPSLSAPVPLLTGDLAGATYGGGAQVTDGMGGVSLILDEGSAAPALDVGDLPDLPTAVSTVGRTVTATLDAATTDVAFVAITDGTNTIWQVNTVGAGTNLSIEFPEVPTGFGDPLNSATEVNVSSQSLEPGTTTADFGPNGFLPFVRRLSAGVFPASF